MTEDTSSEIIPPNPRDAKPKPIEPEPTIGYAQEYVPTLQERFWRWLGFRHQAHAPIINEPQIPFEVQDCIITVTDTLFDWKDRLRILVSGWAQVETRTYAKVKIGETYTVVNTAVITPLRKFPYSK